MTAQAGTGKVEAELAELAVQLNKQQDLSTQVAELRQQKDAELAELQVCQLTTYFPWELQPAEVSLTTRLSCPHLLQSKLEAAETEVAEAADAAGSAMDVDTTHQIVKSAIELATLKSQDLQASTCIDHTSCPAAAALLLDPHVACRHTIGPFLAHNPRAICCGRA